MDNDSLKYAFVYAMEQRDNMYYDQVKKNNKLSEIYSSYIADIRYLDEFEKSIAKLLSVALDKDYEYVYNTITWYLYDSPHDDNENVTLQDGTKLKVHSYEALYDYLNL